MAKLEAASTCKQDSDCRVAIVPPSFVGGCYFPISKDAFEHELSKAHDEIKEICGTVDLYCPREIPEVKCAPGTCRDPSLRLHMRADCTQ